MTIRYPSNLVAISRHLVWCNRCANDANVIQRAGNYHFYAERGLSERALLELDDANYFACHNHAITVNGIRYVPDGINDITELLINSYATENTTSIRTNN